MTVVVAWKRSLPQGATELCFASDSRLSSGGCIDSAQKVFPLQRGDVAIAFAGDTAFAYPYILQLINSINSFRPLSTRGMDLIEIRSHFLKILNKITSEVVGPAEPDKVPEVSFIFGGYSWIKKDFFLWYLYYDEKLKKFHYKPGASLGGVKDCILFAGNEDKKNELRNDLYKMLRKETNNNFANLKLDYEPLMCLNDLLKRQTYVFSTIAYPPQFAKVYQHLNAVAVPLVDDHKNVYLCGRKLLDYERIDDMPLSLVSFKREKDPRF